MCLQTFSKSEIVPFIMVKACIGRNCGVGSCLLRFGFQTRVRRSHNNDKSITLDKTNKTNQTVVLPYFLIRRKNDGTHTGHFWIINYVGADTFSLYLIIQLIDQSYPSVFLIDGKEIRLLSTFRRDEAVLFLDVVALVGIYGTDWKQNRLAN